MTVTVKSATREGKPAYVVTAEGFEQWTTAEQLVDQDAALVVRLIADNIECELGKPAYADVLNAFRALKTFPNLDKDTVAQIKGT